VNAESENVEAVDEEAVEAPEEAPEEASEAPEEAAPEAPAPPARDPLRPGIGSTESPTAPPPVPGINTAGANASAAPEGPQSSELPSSRIGEAIAEQRKLSGLTPDGFPAG